METERTEDQERIDRLLGQIEVEGRRLKEHTAAAAAVREELYPMLYEANIEGRISLAQLQLRTGLTRGRIHQIVNLVKARRAVDRTEQELHVAPMPREKPAVVVEREHLAPVAARGGWGA